MHHLSFTYLLTYLLTEYFV